MKKLLFILLSVMSVSGILAQGFKVMGGLTLSKYSVSNEGTWEFKTGFATGFGYEINITPNIAFEFDTMFIQKGATRTLREYTYRKYSLNEITIPMLVKIRLKPDSSPYILGGGEFSFILSQKEKPGNCPYEIYLMPPSYKKYDYGLVFGGGFE